MNVNLQMPPLTGVVLWAPQEVQKLEELEWDDGWWISAALKATQPGDRLLIYQTHADQGIVALFDVATESFWAEELGYAAYGRPFELPQPILADDLRRDSELKALFGHKQGRFYLNAEQANRLQALLPAIPWQDNEDDPLPEANDPDWRWRPTARLWGRETDASNAIAEHEAAWKPMGFASAPRREHSPHSSLDRTDLMGEDRQGNGMIAEVKHVVAMHTLEHQLDRYLNEARAGGGAWSGHLIALTAVSRPVARAVEERSDVALWLCERDEDGKPELVHVAGDRPPEAR